MQNKSLNFKLKTFKHGELQIRDVSDAKISRSADADADANIRTRRSADANADANICNIIIIHHDFLPTPRRGSHSHV